ncbi:hypothetical protein [Hyphomicrobium zavarzinii]|uniref:hypothetical protein n=1 Tax=Hyphomicrobium zavarzinii TaxID=48292 RepID=UPI0012EB70C3|nr:hypothetical protein [Hyphomicrobium zavarzinii]
MEHSETRFGITLPVLDLSGQTGEMTITPTQPKPCRLICRNGTADTPATLDGEIRLPGIPGLPPEHLRMLFRHPLFDMIVPFSSERRFTLKGSETGWKGTHPPQTWLHFFRMLCFLAEPGAVLQLQTEELPPLEFRNNGAEGSILTRDHRQIEALAQRICRVLELAAIDAVAITWVELLDSQEDVDQFLGFLQGDLKDGYVRFSTGPVPDLPGEAAPCHYFNVFPLGALFIAYSVISAATAQTDEEGTHWELKFQKVGEVTAFSDLERDYRGFQTRVMERSGLNNAVTHFSTHSAGRFLFLRS